MEQNQHQENRQLLNELLVELFNHILLLEERNLKNNGLNGVSINEVHIIEAIAKVESPSMSEVANRLMVTPGTLSTSVNRLIQKGFVTNARSIEDRRVVLLSLTDKGKEVFRIHEEFHKNMINRMLDTTDFNENEVLIKSLYNLMDFFKQIKF